MSFYLSTIFNLFQSIYKLGYSITLNGVQIYTYFTCPPSVLSVNFQRVTLENIQRNHSSKQAFIFCEMAKMLVIIRDLQQGPALPISINSTAVGYIDIYVVKI